MDKIMIGSISLYDMFLYFFIYGFLGWCMEVSYATYRTNKFINRGFLNGPICPIYGVGLLIVLLILSPIINSPLILFLCSILLTTFLELVTGFVLEKFFHAKWWDYSCQRWNFKGYICVKFSFLWGVACLIVLEIFHPIIAGICSKLPIKTGTILIVIFSTFFVADLVTTILQMVHISKNMKQLHIISDALHKGSDKIGQTIYSGTKKSLESFNQIKNKIEKSRISRAYPELKEKIVSSINRIVENLGKGEKIKDEKEHKN